ncbi:unnamed protein product, partial [Peniophora sp. CBMAI 1063]
MNYPLNSDSHMTDTSAPDDSDEYPGSAWKGEGTAFWILSLRGIDKKQERLAHYNKATMTTLLTFAGLFAATVAAFLVDSYKSLSPDPNVQTFTVAFNQTNALLGQLVMAFNMTPV